MPRREYYQANLENLRQYQREYIAKNKERMKKLWYESTKRYEDKPISKEKRAAREAAREHAAEIQLCEVMECGKQGERHHDDYSKPLDIRWLCKLHHMGLHAEMRNKEKDND